MTKSTFDCAIIFSLSELFNGIEHKVRYNKLVDLLLQILLITTDSNIVKLKVIIMLFVHGKLASEQNSRYKNIYVVTNPPVRC